MDFRFEEFFRHRLRVRLAFPTYGSRRLKAIVDAIRPKGPWRVDAVYFLASNIDGMIVHPYTTVRKVSVNRFFRSKEWDLVQHDIYAIVREAERVAQERERGYVSGTSVAVALGNLASELQSTGLQIWGPSEKSDAAFREE